MLYLMLACFLPSHVSHLAIFTDTHSLNMHQRFGHFTRPVDVRTCIPGVNRPQSNRAAVRLDSASKRGRSLDMPYMSSDRQQVIPAWLQAQRDALTASLNSSGLQAQRSALASSLDSMGLHSQAAIPGHSMQSAQACQVLLDPGSEQNEASLPRTLLGAGPVSQPQLVEGGTSHMAGTALPAHGSNEVSKGSHQEGYIAVSKSMSSPFAAPASHSSIGPEDVPHGQSEGTAGQDTSRHAQQAQPPPGASKFGRQRSGSFGGRGAVLGYMMEAHQQWRQDSFSRAQVCLPLLWIVRK